MIFLVRSVLLALGLLVPSPYEGATATLQADSEFAATFRTRLANGLKEGVNFAGDQVLVTWGCGSNCVEGGVVSARSGKAHSLPFTLHKTPTETRPPLLYQRDSRLLVAYGLFSEEQEDGSGRCFVWEATGEWRELTPAACSPLLPQNYDPARLAGEVANCRSSAAGDRQSFDHCLLEISRSDILAFKQEVELLGGSWEMRIASHSAGLTNHFLHTSALIYRLPAGAYKTDLPHLLNTRLHQVLNLVSKREELRRSP